MHTYIHACMHTYIHTWESLRIHVHVYHDDISISFSVSSPGFLFLYHLPQHLKEIKPDDHAVDALGVQLKGGYTISQMMAGPTGSTADARDVVPRLPRLRSVVYCKKWEVEMMTVGVRPKMLVYTEILTRASWGVSTYVLILLCRYNFYTSWINVIMWSPDDPVTSLGTW